MTTAEGLADSDPCLLSGRETREVPVTRLVPDLDRCVREFPTPPDLAELTEVGRLETEVGGDVPRLMFRVPTGAEAAVCVVPRSRPTAACRTVPLPVAGRSAGRPERKLSTTVRDIFDAGSDGLLLAPKSSRRTTVKPSLGGRLTMLLFITVTLLLLPNLWGVGAHPT